MNQALQHVSQLTEVSNQAVAADRVKYAALTCRSPLEDFLRKVQKFDGSLGLSRVRRQRFQDARRRLQWITGPGREAEITKLRSYLDIHIGIINMELIQHGFQRLATSFDEQMIDIETFKGSLEGSIYELRGLREDIQAQGHTTTGTRFTVKNILKMMREDVSAALKSLRARMITIWYV